MDIKVSLEKFLDPHDREDYPAWRNRLRSVMLIMLGLLCFIAVFAIPCLLIVAFPVVIEAIVNNVVPFIVALIVLVFASVLVYAFYRLLGNRAKSKFSQVIWAVVLTLIVIAFIVYVSHLVGDYYGWPNDAHFGRS